MSWDLYVARIPDSIRTTGDLPKDWCPPVIGRGTQLVEQIKAVFPHADFLSADVGHIEGADYSLEVALTAGDQEVDGFMLFVRGGKSAAFAVAELVNAIGARAFDTGAADGTIFPGPDVTAGWRSWRQFRDRVVGQ